MSWTLITRFIVDSWAWMEYLEGSSAGAMLRDDLNDASNDFFTHAVTLAEITSKVKRRGKDSDMAWKVITSNSKILSADLSNERDVGLLHAETKSKNSNFSLGDAFILASSRKISAKVLTGDPDLRPAWRNDDSLMWWSGGYVAVYFPPPAEYLASVGNFFLSLSLVSASLCLITESPQCRVSIVNPPSSGIPC